MYIIHNSDTVLLKVVWVTAIINLIPLSAQQNETWVAISLQWQVCSSLTTVIRSGWFL